MHVVQFILVEASNGSAALQAADEAATNASWSDWHDIGGRWQDYFASTFSDIAAQLEEPTVLPVWDYPVEAQHILDDVAKRQDRVFLECRDALVGNAVAAADVAGHIFGLPVADSEGTAARITAENQRNADEWKRILQASSLTEASAIGFMSLYHARRLVNIIDGNWDSDSGYYDTISYSCNPKYLRDVLTGEHSADYRSGSQLFLVVVDFHY
jgi:hypothetical protein